MPSLPPKKTGLASVFNEDDDVSVDANSGVMIVK